MSVCGVFPLLSGSPERGIMCTQTPHTDSFPCTEQAAFQREQRSVLAGGPATLKGPLNKYWMMGEGNDGSEQSKHKRSYAGALETTF